MMKNKIAYIDESGDRGYTKKSTRYFMLTAVIVDDVLILRRMAKNIYKFKKDKKRSGMLHAYNETNSIRKKIVKEMLGLDIKCFVFLIDKSKLYSKDPYMYLIEKIAKSFKDLNINNVVLARIDTRNNYNRKIIKVFDFYDIGIKLSTPTQEKALQIADFCSWCAFSSLEHNYDEYFNQIKEIFIFI
jgi:hypothetical protein